MLRKAADLIDERIFEIGAALAWKWARTAWKPWAMWPKPPT